MPRYPTSAAGAPLLAAFARAGDFVVCPILIPRRVPHPCLRVFCGDRACPELVEGVGTLTSSFSGMRSRLSQRSPRSLRALCALRFPHPTFASKTSLRDRLFIRGLGPLTLGLHPVSRIVRLVPIHRRLARCRLARLVRFLRCRLNRNLQPVQQYFCQAVFFCCCLAPVRRRRINTRHLEQVLQRGQLPFLGFANHRLGHFRGLRLHHLGDFLPHFRRIRLLLGFRWTFLFRRFLRCRLALLLLLHGPILEFPELFNRLHLSPKTLKARPEARP